jgi:hypothetical protein
MRFHKSGVEAREERAERRAEREMKRAEREMRKDPPPAPVAAPPPPKKPIEMSGDEVRDFLGLPRRRE